MEENGSLKFYPKPMIQHGENNCINLAHTILLVRGCISPKYGFLCVLMALLGSQGIVVKCTTPIFFLRWISVAASA